MPAELLELSPLHAASHAGAAQKPCSCTEFSPLTQLLMSASALNWWCVISTCTDRLLLQWVGKESCACSGGPQPKSCPCMLPAVKTCLLQVLSSIPAPTLPL